MQPEIVFDNNKCKHLMFKELPKSVMEVKYLFRRKLLDEFWIHRSSSAIIKKNCYSKALKDYKYMISLKHKFMLNFVDGKKEVSDKEFEQAFIQEWNLRERYVRDCVRKYFV